MSKRIKMCLYAEPGTGKSVFASKWPKPYFICTDGNYEWLTDFGADPNAHVDCHSYEEVKKAIDKTDFTNYETIVLDLTEDAFKWNESEYCVRNRIEHLSDLGYGKGYDSTRTEFFIEICKLISLDKNVLLLMHGNSWIEKDRRGVDHWMYGPTDRLPGKLIKQIEGRVRYFLRAYTKDEEQDNGTVIKNRYLSLVPKANEFGIIRGVNENLIPQDIPLDFNIFINTLGLKVSDIIQTSQTSSEIKVKEEKISVKEEKTLVKEEVKTNSPDVIPGQVTIEEIVSTSSDKDEAPFDVEEDTATEKTPEPTPQPKKELSNEDKLAAIRAKLAALKK